MKFKDMLYDKNFKEKLNINEEVNTVDIKTDKYYFDIINPDTGFKYDIPMLSTSSPSYYYDYIYYMKIKERTPETFNKILGWD